VKENVEKNEAIEHCHLATIINRREAATRADHEVCYGHLATSKECCGSPAKANRDQAAGHELDQPRGQSQRTMDRNPSAERTKQLLRAMAREEQSHYDPEDCVALPAMSRKKDR